jgi:hypothetical protein
LKWKDELIKEDLQLLDKTRGKALVRKGYIAKPKK